MPQSLHPQFKHFQYLQLLLVISSVDQTSLQIQFEQKNNLTSQTLPFVAVLSTNILHLQCMKHESYININIFYM